MADHNALDATARLQNRVDTLSLMLDMIVSRCLSSAKVVAAAATSGEELASEEAANVAVHMLRQIGEMADRAYQVAGGQPVSTPDAWTFDLELARSVESAMEDARWARQAARPRGA
jgi:hypothetical protein